MYGTHDMCGPNDKGSTHYKGSTQCIITLQKILFASKKIFLVLQICCWGRNVFMGYLNKENDTNEVFNEEFWLAVITFAF